MRSRARSRSTGLRTRSRTSDQRRPVRDSRAPGWRAGSRHQPRGSRRRRTSRALVVPLSCNPAARRAARRACAVTRAGDLQTRSAPNVSFVTSPAHTRSHTASSTSPAAKPLSRSSPTSSAWNDAPRRSRCSRITRWRSSKPSIVASRSRHRPESAGDPRARGGTAGCGRRRCARGEWPTQTSQPSAPSSSSISGRKSRTRAGRIMRVSSR